MSRMYKNRAYHCEQDIVSLFADIRIGAAGAVSNAKGGNIKAVVKLVADGRYEIELAEKYQRLLHVSSIIISPSTTNVATLQILETPANLQADFKADSKFIIQCLDVAGAAVNPASGTEISLQILVRQSSVGPFDI